MKKKEKKKKEEAFIRSIANKNLEELSYRKIILSSIMQMTQILKMRKHLKE